MLLWCCYFHVFFLLANSELVVNKDDDNDQPNVTETIFSEVIKNISRVNNVLQDLIKNYEQLQNMYKEQSLEEDFSSDSEIDEVYKSSNLKQKLRSHNDTILPATKKNFPGTEMIVSEEEPEDITEKSNFIDEAKKIPATQRQQAPDSLNKNKKVKEKKKVKETETSADSSDKSVRDHKHSDEVKVPDNVFYDSVHPKDSKTEKSLIDKNRESAEKTDKETYSTTKANVQGNARIAQQVVYSETFNREKIWDEIANKKPIELMTHRNMPFKNKNNVMSQSQMDLRPNKTAIEIMAKNKGEQQESEEDFSVSINEEEKEINKEMFKSNILRKAYGDACLKVVVRKCSKALKVVGKKVCRASKCKSEFKEKYKDLSKTGCIQQFTQITTNTSYRGVDNDDTFLDATRVGLEACYPMIMKAPISLRNDTPPAQKLDMEVNILRDRFERACQKASTAKCRNACKFAYKGTCAVFECSKSRNKLFEKSCKQECKSSYGKDKKRRGSDSKSGSSDSESDSDNVSAST